MSRTIDLSDPSKLSDDDKRYLQDRGRLPKGVEPPRTSTPFTPLGDVVHTGDANTLALTTEQLEAELKRRRAIESVEAEQNLETDRKELKRQKAGLEASSDDGDDSEVETYKKDDGWTDDKLRNELGRRNLDTSGDRKELRIRLMKDDRDRS